MQAIKALVLGMGVLIVAGLGLLGYGFYTQSDRLERGGGQTAPAAAASARAFGEVTVPLAAGGRITDVAAAAGRLAVRVAEPAGERILILDPSDGSVAGSFVLRAAPSAAPGAVPLR